jgi:hypothetical protein
MNCALAKYARKNFFFCALWTCAVLSLTTCGTPATPAPTPRVVSVYATAAAQPWLADVSDCAAPASITIRFSVSPSAANIRLRIGEPENLNVPAYQIDREDLLVVTHRESLVQNLTAEEVRVLFSHPEGQSAQIWVFASGEDIQQIFLQEIMQGTTVSSFARLAVSPRQMFDAIHADKTAIGLLPRHLKTETVREVFSLPNLPVLALTAAEPQGAIKEILACLQK